MKRVALAVVLAVAASAAPAQATVRRCLDRVASGPQTAASMMQGRRLAVEAWSRAASVLGAVYGDWRNAGTRSLVCGPAATAGVVCEARAYPCAASAGNRQVPGVKPLVPEPKVITVPAPAAKSI